MPQSKVSQIKNYKLQNISLERLMQALVALDQRVEILARASRGGQDRGGGVTEAQIIGGGILHGTTLGSFAITRHSARAIVLRDSNLYDQTRNFDSYGSGDF